MLGRYVWGYGDLVNLYTHIHWEDTVGTLPDYDLGSFPRLYVYP